MCDASRCDLERIHRRALPAGGWMGSFPLTSTTAFAILFLDRKHLAFHRTSYLEDGNGCSILVRFDSEKTAV